MLHTFKQHELSHGWTQNFVIETKGAKPKDSPKYKKRENTLNAFNTYHTHNIHGIYTIIITNKNVYLLQ